MRTVVLRAVASVAGIASVSVVASPASAGPPIDLHTLPLAYDYGGPLQSHGFWVPPREGGEWRVVGGQLGEDDRLKLEVEIRPPAISVPLEAGPAILFGELSLYGGFAGDIGVEARIGRVVARALLDCADPSECAYRGSIILPTDRLPRLARRHQADGWGSAAISLTLVRTYAQGTWLQVLPLYDEAREEPDGTVGRPLPISSRMLVLGAAPVGPRELWSRHDRAVLDRIDRLRREAGDMSRLPDTQPLLIDIDTVACTHGWTVATATGDTLVNVSRRGTSIPLRVDAPVGTEWTVSVPSLDRAQGIGESPDRSEPFSSDGPGVLSGVASGDPYDCEGVVEAGSIAWRLASADEIGAFHEAELDAILDTYTTLPARPVASTVASRFQRLWDPLAPADVPFDHGCEQGLTFTLADLAAARTLDEVPERLAAAVGHWAARISPETDGWTVVAEGAGEVLPSRRVAATGWSR